MSDLKESIILKKTYLYFLLPSLVVGIIGLFLPLVYALVPAHESGECICYVQQDFSLIPLPKVLLLTINTLMFYGVNWVFLLLLVLMFNRIRHINDKLQTRDEMRY